MNQLRRKFRYYLRRGKLAAGLHVPAHIGDDVLQLQYERIRSMIPIIYVTVAIITTVAAAASQGSFTSIYNIIFPAIFICAGVVRCLAWFRRSYYSVDLKKMRNYLRSTTLIALTLSLIGSVWTLDSYFETQEARRVLAPVFIFMGVFATAICLTSLPKAGIGCVVTALTPIAIAMIMSTDLGIRAMGISLLVVSLLLIKLLANNFAQMVKSLSLQLALKKLSETDSLTHVANRRAFTATFEAVMGDVDTAQRPAVVMIDLDGFKGANDQFGHAAGDAILVEAASRLKTLCTGAACVARLGGDEFAVLFATGGNLNHCHEQKTAISKILSMPYIWDNQQIIIGASVGMASSPENGNSMTELLRHADRQLYKQKTVIRRQSAAS